MTKLITEAELFEAIASGNMYPAGGASIKASVLRDVLKAISAGKPAPQGLRIAEAKILGLLNLSGGLGDGSPFCPIKFYKCTFTEGLRFDRASFTRLSLDSSQFHRFQARDATFLSTLDLRNVRSPDAPPPPECLHAPTPHRDIRPLEPGECSIDLANAHIHGDLWLNEASLKVGSPYGSEKEIGPYIYALILRGAEIRGAARLEPGFKADGGVSVADAHIQGDLRMHGATLYAQYGAALRAQNARIDGIVFCRARTDITKPGETTAFQATGCRDGALTFQNAKLGRLDLRGAHVTAGKLIDGNADKDWVPRGAWDRAGIAIDLSNSIVSAGIIAGQSKSNRQDCILTGWVILHSTQVQGDVTFTGTKIDARAAYQAMVDDRREVSHLSFYALDLRSADIRGSVRLDFGFEAEGGVTVADSKIGGDLSLQAARLRALGESSPHSFALRGRNANISGVLRCGTMLPGNRTSGQFVCQGGLSFPNSSMDMVDLTDVSVVNPGGDAVDFSNAEIRGDLKLTCNQQPANNSEGGINGHILLTDSHTLGNIEIQYYLPHFSSKDGPIIDFDGTSISGNCKIRTLGFGDSDPKTDCKLQLRFRSAVIGRDLNIESDYEMLDVDAAGLDVSGSVIFSGLDRTIKKNGKGNLTNSRIKYPRMNLELTGFKTGQSFSILGFDIEVATIIGASIEREMIIDNVIIVYMVDLTSANIKQLLFLNEIEMRESSQLLVANANIGSALKARQMTSETYNDDGMPVIDLSNTRVSIIDDLIGTAWPWDCRLILRNLTYDILRYDEVGIDGIGIDHWNTANDNIKDRYHAIKGEHVFRLTFFCEIAAILIIFASLALYNNRNVVSGYLSLSIIFLILPIIFLLIFRILFITRIRRVFYRLAWLDRQFLREDASRIKRYYPQPYTQVAHTYRSMGLHEAADNVLIQRARLDTLTRTYATVERAEQSRSPSEGLGTAKENAPRLVARVWRLISISMPRRIFDVTFRYGFSAAAAVTTVVCFALFGAMLTAAQMESDAALRTEAHLSDCSFAFLVGAKTLERSLPPLDVKASQLCPATALAKPKEDDADMAPMKHPDAGGAVSHNPAEPNTHMTDRRASDGANRPTAADTLWRAWWAFYGFLSWLIVSFTMLTISGLIRRFSDH